MRADRLLSILLLLQTGGRRPARDLAVRLEVSERTIYRDLDALSAAGVPVYAVPGPGGGVALAEGFRTDLTGLTAAEAGGIFAAGAAGPLADLGIGEARDRALIKLFAALPAAQRRAAERVRERVLLDASRWQATEEAVPHLATIQEALFADRVLRLTYQRDDGELRERRLAPLGLVAKASVWYLVAGVAETGEGDDPRTFRVSRIRRAEMTDEPARRPDRFDLAAFWSDRSAAFVRGLLRFPVTLRVAPELVPDLPRIIGEWVRDGLDDAVTDAVTDAAGWRILAVTFDSPEAARTMLLGLGDRAEALSPPELRRDVVDRAAALLAFYRGGAPPEG